MNTSRFLAIILTTIQISRLTSSLVGYKCLSCVVDKRLSMVQGTNITKSSDAATL